MGRESDGIPIAISQEIEYQLKIPMAPHRRSLNVAMATAMVVGEARRQIQTIS